MLNISESSYVTLCALVLEAMEAESDARPLLARVAEELAAAASSGLSEAFLNDAGKRAALEKAGMIRRAS